MTQINQYKCNLCGTVYHENAVYGVYWTNDEPRLDIPEDHEQHICMTCVTGICKEDKRPKQVADPEPEVTIAKFERLTKELADLRNSMYGRMLSWPEDRNCLGEADLPFAVKADDLREMVAAKAEVGLLRAELIAVRDSIEIVQAIETLRKRGGRFSVHPTIGLQTSIGVIGDWTSEEWRTFRGDTLHAALAAAVEAKSERRED